MSRKVFLRGVVSAGLAVALMMTTAHARAASAPAPIDPHRVDGSAMGAPIDITSTWLVQQGDDPRWADPKFDDSQWVTVDSSRTLGSYGLKDVDKIWYRTHVQVPAGRSDLALMMRQFGGSFEIFVDGIDVGGSGPHPAGGSGSTNFDEQFAIPASASATGDLTIAVRADIGRLSQKGKQPGGFANFTEFLLGPASELRNSTLLYRLRDFASNTANIVMEILVGLIALALALSLPKEREYVLLFIGSMARAAGDILTILIMTGHVGPTAPQFLLSGILTAVALVAMLEFVRLVLGLRRARWYVVYMVSVAAVEVTFFTIFNYMYALGSTAPTGSLFVATNVFAQILSFPISLGIPVLALWVWWRRRNPDALLLFVPFFIQAVVQYCNFALFLLYNAHLSDKASLPPVPLKTFFLQWGEVASFLFGVALLLFLVLRTARMARSRAAMASDLHAVQSVQEFLLARASHPTPGFRVEHVYYPASEVGGDFFLVSPGPDGSLTAIVGDVSGKGLVAAMRVSMILGVLRREEEREPGMVLKALNDSLLMQTDMGFTTACCVHLDRDGCYAMANAGHINPYINGEEIVIPAALPLGLAPGQQYEQITGYLPEGQTLVLMSDGVVEARSAKGELYGFERLRKLTLLSAGDIADVARRFGQEDDITVLTVACG